MLTPTQPYRKELGDGLVLKSLAGEEDVERLAAFNGAVHGDDSPPLIRAMLLHHPHTRPEHWLFVEDEAGGQVVSSLCLIPWTWCYEDVELKAGQMEFVGTLEAYRHRGLIRAQVARFDELLREGGYDLSHIGGIGYFYRQFGYEYALSVEGGWRVEPHLIPDAPADESQRCTFRRATLDDLPVLMRMYDEAMNDLSIRTVRDEATWRYFFGPALESKVTGETWLVSDQAEQPVGYFRILPYGPSDQTLFVGEVSRLSGEAALATLRQVKVLAAERDNPYVRLELPESSTLVQTARHLEAHDRGTYAWQIRLLDVGRFLQKLAPVLERRLAASPFAGLTKNVCFNLYREAFEMRFEGGRLTAVEPLGFKDGGDICIPPLLAVPLLLGYRDRATLRQAHHDVDVNRESRYLIDVLFPTVASFIHFIY